MIRLPLVLDNEHRREHVTVTWATPTGEVLATATTDSSGSATASVVVSAVTAGRYEVYADGDDGPTTRVALNVT